MTSLIGLSRAIERVRVDEEVTGTPMKYWLMKSEPDVYGIDHLRAEKRKTDHWDGIRNYQARNFMRDEMKKGDLAFFLPLEL